MKPKECCKETARQIFEDIKKLWESKHYPKYISELEKKWCGEDERCT